MTLADKDTNLILEVDFGTNTRDVTHDDFWKPVYKLQQEMETLSEAQRTQGIYYWLYNLSYLSTSLVLIQVVPCGDQIWN